MEKKFKLTTLERNWILYDVGNSAFILLVSTLIPIYFNSLAGAGGLNESQYLAFWGYAGSVSTLMVAFIAPICGTLADQKGFKKKLFVAMMLLGVIGCAALGAAWSWLSFLVIYVLAKVGYSSSLVFYDAMLPEVTTDARMDNVSSQGYAYGYIGSVIPFILCLVLVLLGDKIGLSAGTAMTVSFLLVAVWWLGCTLPLLKSYRQKAYVERAQHPIKDTFRQLGRTFRDASKEKHILLYLIAFFFFIDGVYTIIDMATAYGTALGLDTTGLLLALLLTQYGKTYLGGYNQFCLVENRTSIMMDISRKFNTTGYPNTLRAEFLRLRGKADDATDNNQSSTEELYRTMGRVFKPREGMSYYIISPHEEFEKLFGRPADKRRKLYNGMIKCQLFMYFK